MSTQDKNQRNDQDAKRDERDTKRDEQNTKVGNNHDNTTTTTNPERKDQDREPTVTEPQKIEVNEKRNQEKADRKTALSDRNKKH